MTIERKRLIRTIGELRLVLDRPGCFLIADERPVTEVTTADELVIAMEERRLWAVTYEKVGGKDAETETTDAE